MTRDALYLETCCRSALHRLFLAGDAGRPVGSAEARSLKAGPRTSPLKDKPCLERLAARGLARQRSRDARFVATEAGRESHARLVSGLPRQRKFRFL